MLESEKLRLDQAELAVTAREKGVKLATQKRVEDNKLDLELMKAARDKKDRS